VPTPLGKIAFAFDTNHGSGFLTVPNESRALLAVPKCGYKQPTIAFNGLTYWKYGTIMNSEYKGIITEDEGYVYFDYLESGHYKISVAGPSVFTSEDGPLPVQKLVNKLSLRAFTNLNYRAKFVGFDRTTQGNWIGKYGADGYLFFGDVVQKKFPSYVHNITWRPVGDLGSSRFLTTTTADSRALINTTDNNLRFLGAATTQNPSACLQTFTIDIVLSQNHRPFQVSLYFADWDTGDRRQMVEMRDYDTREIIAPSQLLSYFSMGVYAVYQHDGSVRFRVNHIRGGDATLSAIFFD